MKLDNLIYLTIYLSIYLSVYLSREKGITNLSILNMSSYSDWNLFWDAKIFRTREIMTLFKLKIPQYFRLSTNFILLLNSTNRKPWYLTCGVWKMKLIIGAFSSQILPFSVLLKIINLLKKHLLMLDSDSDLVWGIKLILT